MATHETNFSPTGDLFTSAPREAFWIASAVLFGCCYLASFFAQKSSDYPSINYDKSQFRTNAKKLIAQGFQKVCLSKLRKLGGADGQLVLWSIQYRD
jgi:hypothetical protein